VEAGGAPPGAALPVQAEIVHESARTRVTRLSLPGGTVIRKEPLGPDSERRARHETAMLKRLRGVGGIAQLAEAPRYPGSVMLADAGAASLAGLAKPLAVDHLIGLMVVLTRAVAGMHGRGVLHRDIAPANIMLSGDGVPCLVDFVLATSLAEIRPQFMPYSEIVGTLAYLAPEATGRTARPVDQRADLYALGAVLYELATGTPPFGSGDPLRLVRDHLARLPTPPAQVNPAVPAPLSEVIMHMLDKEPDSRYQTADGVLYDLERLRGSGSRPAARISIGDHDVPPRLLAPSRLVGRDAEMAALEAAFADALAGRCQGVLLSGEPGVGKTALADELRPVVTGRDGWFVAGKFDQYRRNPEFDAVGQALGALGRLLLAEPDDELAEVRARVLAAVGANGGLVAAVMPEFAALLGVPPDPGDPLTARVRAQRAAAQVLRAVASPKRPVVVVIDDLQWAGRTPLGFVDLMLSEEPTCGLLLVGVYREGDMEAAHPLAAGLSRWREQAGVRHLHLGNLPLPGLVTMVAEMLHTDLATAAALSEVIAPQTSGNPYETAELLNALRRDGVLTVTPAGWRWDQAAVRGHLSRSETAGLRDGQAEAVPPPSRQVLEVMVCLGGRAELTVLQTATGEPPDVVDQRLAPAFGEGLLVVEPGTRQAVRFRHDRIREAILSRLDPPRRRAVQLAMARRLACVPELSVFAAEQYLPVIDAVSDSTERRQVARLLRHAARQSALIGDYQLVTGLLSAALQLIEPGETATLIEVRTGRHSALFSLGRLDEADEDYRIIEELSATLLGRADATCVQVRSLTHRKRFADAIGLGVKSLRELGIAVPPGDQLPAELDRQFRHLYRWLDSAHGADELSRPDITDPALLATTGLINATVPAPYYADTALYAWLILEALRIWLEHGPCHALVGPVSHTAFIAVTLRGDYAAGYRALQRIVALGEARDYEPGTSQARFLFAVLACWFEPIENGVQAAQRAREGLVAGGDLAYAGYTYYPAGYYLLDCAPSLDVFLAEVEAGLAFARRTGNEEVSQHLDCCRWLAGVLRGESSAAAEAVLAGGYSGFPLALFRASLTRAVAAAIFGDPDGLARHTAATIPLLPAAMGLYQAAVARLLRGLTLAEQVRTSPDGHRAELLAELDEMTRWLAERAAHAPDNFLHLQRFVEAERAWAAGDFRAAGLAFDAARHESAKRQRPWHQALITERAARFYLEHGFDHAGYELLAQAYQQYLAWGATAKAAQLAWAYPALQSPRDALGAPGGGQPADTSHVRSAVTTGAIDLLGILSASRALSSETSINRLYARLVQVLVTMTGATGVHLVLRSEERQEWLLPALDSESMVPVAGIGDENRVPVSALRYAQRMREPLVVADATADDRFARDPYFAGVEYCSLLAVPVLSRGILRAVLILENRLIRGGFSTGRLDAVQLIAGQLAVSLDNAQLYAQLTTSRARIVAAADQARRRIERDLHDGAQQRLVSLALQLRAAQAMVPPALGEFGAQLGRAVAEATSALDELREIARGIHPAILTDGGLRPALRALARRSPVPVDLDMRVDGRLPEPVEVTAYYIVAEALTNAAKHAQASAISVQVEAATDILRLAVRDDGTGGASFTGGTGLAGLKDRVEAVGGRIFLDSPRGAGTSLHAELSLNSADGNVTS
jgi:predicted ATPase/signal transduction histidine kinase